MKWAYVGPSLQYSDLPLDFLTFKKMYSGNTGNLIYYFATRMLINFNNNYFTLSNIPKAYTDSGNGIVYSMANHLGAHVDMSEHGLKIDHIDSPVVALGLGAQAEIGMKDIDYIPKGTIKYLASLVDHAPSKSKANIIVRGDYTFDVMDKLGFGGNILALGCQTNFMNPDKTLGKSIRRYYEDRKIKKVSIAAGNIYLKHYRTLEISLLSLAAETNGDYIVQHPQNLIKLAGRFNEKEFKEELELSFALYCEAGMEKDKFEKLIRNNFKLYSDVPQWIRSHKQTDIVVGTRIHGVQSALQAGVPAICLYIDSRTKELCEKMKIPHADAQDFKTGININDIENVFLNWDYEEFDRNRINLALKYKEFLETNKIEASKNFNQLLEV